MEEYFWVRGTKENGATWDSGILFTCKEAAIIHATFQKETKNFKEIHVEKITATEEVWKSENKMIIELADYEEKQIEIEKFFEGKDKK